MSTPDFSSQPVSKIPPQVPRVVSGGQMPNLMNFIISQELSSDLITDWTNADLFYLPTMSRRFAALENKVRRYDITQTQEEVEEGEEVKILEVQKTEEASQRFERDNFELQSRSLINLRSRIKASDTGEEILQKVLSAYPDFSLADDALSFLLETSYGELNEKIALVRKDFNDRFNREITAGKNIAAQAREFSEKGLGSATALRDMYREVTGNPREPAVLFEELSKEFPYAKMKTVIDFILHALGGDLKSKGPSISRAELHRLMTEARTMQAILGIYRFFQSRMKLIYGSFERYGIPMGPRMNFELLAKAFMRFLQERYPSAEKVLLLAGQLGITDELLAEMIIFTQMRDAVRQIAPKVFNSEQHRADVLTAFMTALEDLDEKLEEEEEKEEKDKDGPL